MWLGRHQDQWRMPRDTKRHWIHYKGIGCAKKR
jgi:hypothetical protein